MSREYSARREKRHTEAAENAVCGRNAVTELLRSGKSVDKIFIANGAGEGSIRLIEALARSLGVPVVRCDKGKLESLCGGVATQGVAALTAGTEYVTVDDILRVAEERGESPFIVICDGVEDPHNLGAIIRCAEGAGAHGVIIPKRRSSSVTPAAVKASAGAAEHMAVAKVSNLASTLDALKEKGIWTYAAEAGAQSVYDTDMTGPIAVVMGGEDSGVSRLLLEKCDFTVSIPMYGKVNSFNVATAAAVILCEAAHKRNQRTE